MDSTTWTGDEQGDAMTRIMFLCLVVVGVAGCEAPPGGWFSIPHYSDAQRAAMLDYSLRINPPDTTPVYTPPPLYMPPPPTMTQCHWNGPVWQCQ
jgi:hypothetical protein